MPYTTLKINATQELSDYLNIDFEDLIEIGVDYDYKHSTDEWGVSGYDVNIEEVYYNKNKVTDCFTNKDFEYLEQYIIDEGVE